MKTSPRTISLLAVTTLLLTASAAPEKGYVAHEWGTFTSVQGADGKQLDWNPLTVSELPGFVYHLGNAGGGERASTLRFLTAKTGFVMRQRMETPVIYFYADRPQTVDVDIRFPQGVVTEWFPQARPLPRLAQGGEPVRDRIAWDRVEILPRETSVPLPSDASGSHYFAARGAEANPVAVKSAAGVPEVEKFLFYRGVGNFTAPLTVTTGDEARELQVKNDGKEALGRLFVLQIRDGEGAFQELSGLDPGAARVVRLGTEGTRRPLADLRRQLRARVADALVADGLFAAEAEAMVATWDDSWFTETGLRVLYTLPTAWVDRVLPLKLTPAPTQVARVFVGRAEVLTPAVEFALLRQLLRFHDGEAGDRTAAITAAKALQLGRFAEPAVRHILAGLPANRAFSNHAWELLEAVAKPEPAKSAAQPAPGHAGVPGPELPSLQPTAPLTFACGAVQSQP